MPVRTLAQFAFMSMAAHLMLTSMGILILHSRKYIFLLGQTFSNQHHHCHSRLFKLHYPETSCNDMTSSSL